MSLKIRELANEFPGLTLLEIKELKPAKDYSDGRTKQSFKDETNINKLLARAQRSGTLNHIEKYGGMYGEMADFDLLEAQLRIRRAQESFDKLPSEVRSEFNHSPAAFFKFVNDPANKDDLATKLPALAKPGRQNIDVSGKSDPTKADAPVAPPAAPAAPKPTTPDS